MAADLFDPLHGLSVLSLLSRTLKGVKGAAGSEQRDLDSILNSLHVVNGKSSDVYLEEAKTVLSCSLEFQGDELREGMKSGVLGGEVMEEGRDRPQERRPGLGRKRARFSFKPNTSQPSLDLDESLNIDQLQDPEEFFAAVEKRENAERELKKQRGEALTDVTQHKPRGRRPGILGASIVLFDVRKKASYKHRYSDSDGGDDLELIPEKEQLDAVHEEATQGKVFFFQAINNFLNLNCSADEEPNKVDSLLDELLSVNATDLDGDGAVSLLEEHLQIKSFKLDKYCMPDFESLRKSNSKTVVNQRDLPRPRTPLSNVQNIVTRINQQERSAYPHAPPAQLKSPLSSLSMLKRRIALPDSTGNPFTFHSTDISSPSHSSPSAYGDDADLNANDPHTPPDSDQLNIPEKSHATLPEGRYAADGDGLSGKLATENLSQPLEPMVDNGNRSTIDTGLQQNGSGRGLAEDRNLQSENVASENDLTCQDSTTESLNSDERRLGPSPVEDNQMDQQSDAVNILPDRNKDNLGAASKKPEKEKGAKVTRRKSKEVPSPVEDHQMDQQPDAVNIFPDRNNKDNQELLAATSKKTQKEKEARVTRRKRKEVPSRKSLAGAGTMWESGIRRSTRVRMRPLEYWKGERFLYGRVHETLLTVIGCKYESPSSATGKPKLKVKSFVSDNFKELVEKAALH
ncbi:hypothetical protein Sjap_019388 [Stephania japonica]|uniref:Centromere protein C n=1 Tax=Stephania japonica TaxID=461633 RepID=A0AAP0HZP0_9MAGN